MSAQKHDGKVPFEEAIDKAGFGLYSYILTALSGCMIIAFACIGYGTSIIVPTSACELNTTVSQQGLLVAAPVVGSIIGGLVWGYLADTRGRRSMILVSLVAGSVVNMLASFSVNWIMMMVLQFTATFLTSGLFSMSITLLSESVPMAKRNLVVLFVTSIFMLAQGIMAVIAIPIIPLTFAYHIPALGIYWNSWRTLMLMYTIPAILCTIWMYFMHESPKFVFAKGDEARAMQILRIIHRTNNGKSQQMNIEGLIPEEQPVKTGPSSPKDQVVPLFRAPLLKYTLIMFVLFLFQQVAAFGVWLPTIANQFVKVLETGVGSDLTLCGIISASTEEEDIESNVAPCALNVTSLLLVLGVGGMQSVVNILLSLIVNKTGRRNLVMGFTALCGLSGILVNLVPNAIGSAVLFAVLLLGIIILGLYTAIIVAIFPTQLRTMAVALPMTVGRIASFASIQVLNLLLANNCDVGFYLFASLFASSSIIASFLPDDRRLQPSQPPPQTEEPQPRELEPRKKDSFNESYNKLD